MNWYWILLLAFFGFDALLRNDRGTFNAVLIWTFLGAIIYNETQD